MVNAEIRKKLSSLYNELYSGIGQPGFLAHTCEEYKKIMNFQCCHIVHLQGDGQFNFEYKNGKDDYSGLIRYQHEDIWRPENSGEPINKLLHLRIDRDFHLELSGKFNLYNWLYNKMKAYDSLGTIHPCNTSFTCFRLGESNLDDEEYALHLQASDRIINLYYLDRRLKYGMFFENLFSEQKGALRQQPVIILDGDFNLFHEEKEFINRLHKLKLNYRELVGKIRYKITYSKPEIIDFNEKYRLRLRSSSDKIEILIQSLFYSGATYYVCSLELDNERAAGFSSREKQILRLVGEGLSNREIAESLFITNDTVKKHLYNMMRKTKSKNRVELLKYRED